MQLVHLGHSCSITSHSPAATDVLATAVLLGYKIETKKKLLHIMRTAKGVVRTRLLMCARSSVQVCDAECVCSMVLAGYQGDGGNSVWRMLLSCSDQSHRDAGYSELLLRRVCGLALHTRVLECSASSSQCIQLSTAQMLMTSY